MTNLGIELNRAIETGIPTRFRVVRVYGDTTIGLARGGDVFIQVGQRKHIVPLAIALALAAPEVKEFLEQQSVLGLTHTRESSEQRKRSIGEICANETHRLRLEWTRKVVAEGLCEESEAFLLAKLKFKDIPG